MNYDAAQLHDLIAHTEAYCDDAILIIESRGPVDEDIAILWCNAGFERMTGYARSEIVGRSPIFLRGADTDPVAVATMARRRDAHEPFRVEILNYRRDGAAFWVDISAKPCVRLPGGGAIYLSVQRDITAMKLREIALTEALAGKALLAAVSDAVSSEIHVFDAQTLRYVQVNEAARRATGLRDAAMRAATPLDFWRDVSAAGLREVVAPLLDGREREVSLQFTQQPHEGAPYACAARLSSFQHMGLSLVLASVEDISQQDRAARRLRFAERRYQLALEASADGVWERVIPGDYVHFSARNRQMLGYDEAAFPDDVTSWRRFVHPDDKDRVLAALRACVEHDAPYDQTYRMRRSDGAWMWWRSRASVMRDEDGAAVRIIGTNSDVTELVEARRAAEVSARAKADFLTKMSHEVRTPLNGVLGMAELMRFSEEDPEKLSRLDTILSSGQSLLTIIEDVLTLARIETGVECVRETDFDPRTLCDEAFAPVRVAAADKGLALINDAPAGRWRGDARRIRQVLINLIGNALKYTPHGAIRLSAAPLGDSLRFCVADTGPGVPEALREEIFEPFRQGRTGDVSGLGLGLAVAREFVRAMGGRIGVEGAKDSGAVFWFTAPVSVATAQGPPGGPATVDDATPFAVGRVVGG